MFIYDRWGRHNCGHHQDVGVCCNNGCTKGGGSGGRGGGGAGACASNFNGVAVLATRDLSLGSGTKVSDWGGFKQANPDLQPKFSSGENGFVNFASGQFLDGGELQFNLQSGGGFTAVVVVKFADWRGSWQRVFDFGNAQERGNILFARCGEGTGVAFLIFGGSGGQQCGGCTGGVINPSAFQTYVLRYNAQSNQYDMMVDGNYIYGKTYCPGRPEDRTLLKYIYKVKVLYYLFVCFCVCVSVCVCVYVYIYIYIYIYI